MNMKPNFRRGEHLDISTQPWLGNLLAEKPLNKLVATLPSQRDMHGRFQDALMKMAGEDKVFTIQSTGIKPNLAMMVADTLHQIATVDVMIHFEALYGDKSDDRDSICGVTLADLRTTPILELGQAGRTPMLFVLACAYRAAVLKRCGPVPGINNGFTLAGLHFVLNQLGIKTGEE